MLFKNTSTKMWIKWKILPENTSKVPAYKNTNFLE